MRHYSDELRVCRIHKVQNWAAAVDMADVLNSAEPSPLGRQYVCVSSAPVQGIFMLAYSTKG